MNGQDRPGSAPQFPLQILLIDRQIRGDAVKVDLQAQVDGGLDLYATVERRHPDGRAGRQAQTGQRRINRGTTGSMQGSVAAQIGVERPSRRKHAPESWRGKYSDQLQRP